MSVSSSPQFRLIALLVAGAYFMEQLDGTVIATALPQMALSFGTRAVDLNVGMSAYLLTLAVFVPASGWVADRFGARTVFAGAIGVFTAASILCAMSTGLGAFIAARVLQGFGGAMMVPVGRLVVLRNSEKHELMRAIAYITWPALAAPVLGPPLGGFLTTYASWHWIFLLNVPLGVVGIALALLLVPNHRGEPRPFDWLGFVLIGLSCLGLMYGLELAARPQTPWPWVAVLLLGSIALGILALWHARRHPHALLDLSALRVPSFAITARGGSLFRISISALPFLLPLMFQVGFGLDAFRSGLLVLAVFAGNIGMKPATNVVLRTFGLRTTLIVNGLISAATMFACALLWPQTPTPVVLAILFVSGLSRSMQFTALNTLAFADLPKERMSHANTMFSMLQQLASGIGIASGAIALRMSGLFDHGQPAAPTLWDFHVAFVCVGVLALAGTLDCVGLVRDAGAVVSGHKAAPSARRR